MVLMEIKKRLILHNSEEKHKPALRNRKKHFTCLDSKTCYFPKTEFRLVIFFSINKVQEGIL